MSTITLYICAILILIRLFVAFSQLWNRRPFVWAKNGDHWAVITGSTDGTGYEFARQLALKGYNLMLISRSEDKLKQTKQHILEELSTRKEKEVQIRTLAVDFCHLDIYERIKQFLSIHSHDVFILINNVGICPPMPEYFVNETEQDHSDMINVNIVSATKMLEMVLPSMVAKRRGLVVNVCSVAARHLFSLASTYSASKAYLGQLSECLSLEYGCHNITFCTLYPSAISTKMIYHAKRDFMTASPEEYVRSALHSIRYQDSIHTTGFWPHSLIELGINVLTVLLSKQIAGHIIQLCTTRYRHLIIQHNQASQSIKQPFNMWNVLNAK